MADEERQFDFWLGDWVVRDAEGKLAGRNLITRAVGEFGLREEWRGESGLSGTSLNAWDAQRGVWHQTWIDSSGTVLLLEGGLRGGVMVMQGVTLDPDKPAGRMHHRISWSVMDGDPARLRQHWEGSADGKTWRTLFDGRYERALA